MSMPNIPNIKPDIDISREDALNMLLASIALEEMGLAHIINAEGEKIQYVLNSKLPKSPSVAEVREVNAGVEKIIREAMKLQMLLQEKLESVLDRIPVAPGPPCPRPPCTPEKPCPRPPCPPEKPCPRPPCPPHKPCPRPPCPPHKPCRPEKPCPPPPKPECGTECTLKGSGKGTVNNASDCFHCGTAFLEAGSCPLQAKCGKLTLKYTLRTEKDDHAIPTVFVSVPGNIEVHCPKFIQPCPLLENPNMLTVRGRGLIKQKAGQCSVSFSLTAWDFGYTIKFRMKIDSSDPGFHHDSGIVAVSAGDLAIVNYFH
ncbi:hypothetical protein QBE55_08790 [Eubacteriales bacterium mix99]|jgi:hypothetical protein